MLQRYRSIGQDPERFPILRKESELDAWRLELGIRETSEAVCQRLEPLIKSLQFPTPPKPTENAKKPIPAKKEPVRRSKAQHFRHFIALSYVPAVLSSGLIGFSIGQAQQGTPVVIDRVPPQIYLYREGVNAWLWEGTGDPAKDDGRWIPTKIIDKTPTQQK